MLSTLQVGNQILSAADLIPLINRYQLLPTLPREIIVDQAIASIHCTPEEIDKACQQFEETHQLNSPTARQAFCDRHGLSIEEIETLAIRQLRIEKFKQDSWAHQLESYFLQHKRQLDRAIYSLIRTQDWGIAQELYFRIQEREQSFAEIAKVYSQGPEAKMGGLTGPVELRVPHSQIAHLLSISQPGQLWPPQPIGEWFVILRLEELIPARLDAAMRRRLLDELFTRWLAEQQHNTSACNLT